MRSNKSFRDGVRMGLRVAYLTVLREYPDKKETLSYIKEHHDEIAKADNELRLAQVAGMRQTLRVYKQADKNRRKKRS